MFVAPGSQVIRVVHVEPVMASSDAARRVGAVVTEAILPRDGRVRDPGASPIFESALAPLMLREVYAGADETLSPFAFRLTTTTGTPLLTAMVPPRGLSDLRAAWRGRTIGFALLALAITLVLLALVLRDAQERELNAGRFAALLLAMVALLLSARALIAWAIPAGWHWSPSPVGLDSAWLRSPVDWLATALLALALVALLFDLVARGRLARRARASACRATTALVLAGAGGSWRPGGRRARRAYGFVERRGPRAR